jgi:galactokinase
MQISELKQQFARLYGDGDFQIFHSPGRVNLIGEHTDYNGGYVFPCALTLGTYGIAKKRRDDILRLASANFKGQMLEIGLDAVVYDKKFGWGNYLLGVVDQFQKMGIKIGGLDVLISGDMPANAGLSSSASVEMLMAVIINTLYDCGLPMIELVKLSQRAENQFVGVNCGIMDQFAVGMGKKDAAMLLDCMTLDFDYIPVVLGGYCLVISNTNSPRSLVDSKYNERRGECEKAAGMLRENLDIQLLGDITPEDFEANKHLITDETILKRATHVIYEIGRTKEAAARLAAGDLAAFGRLMYDSHNSLAKLYEVTGRALDTMVDAAKKQDGVLGSRMTGAGFGGCTISLVKRDHVDDFIENVGREYAQKTGIGADFYIAGIGDGARILQKH